MIAIIDYGVGNLFSLKSSFAAIGKEAIVTNNVNTIQQADRIILPGVGAFADASKKLVESGMAEVLDKEKESGKPIMGICLGMQLLFEKSYEYGEYKGLGYIKGSVQPLSNVVPSTLKIPHMGWNALHFTKGPHPLFKYISENDCVYFVHSYYGADCLDSTIATVEYSAEITAAVADKNILGCQFHPEKSGTVGLDILKGFCELGENDLC